MTRAGARRGVDAKSLRWKHRLEARAETVRFVGICEGNHHSSFLRWWKPSPKSTVISNVFEAGVWLVGVADGHPPYVSKLEPHMTSHALPASGSPICGFRGGEREWGITC